MIVPAYPGCVVPLEKFMAWKFGLGFFSVLFEGIPVATEQK